MNKKIGYLLLTLSFLMCCMQGFSNVPSAQIASLIKRHNIGDHSTSASLQERPNGTSIPPEIQDLQSNYEFVLFFRSNCPHCHRFVPILKDFATYYGIKIIAYSTDGPDLDGLHARKMTASEYKDYFLQGGFKAVVPALYLQNKHTDQAYPVLFGEAEPYQLAKRINELMQHIKTQQAEEVAEGGNDEQTN